MGPGCGQVVDMSAQTGPGSPVVEPIPGLELPQPVGGALHRAAAAMIEHLRQSNRLALEDEPLAQMLLKYAHTLDTAATGRGASIALVGAQFTATWERLKELEAPSDAAAEEFDVVLLPVARDAS